MCGTCKKKCKDFIHQVLRALLDKAFCLCCKAINSTVNTFAPRLHCTLEVFHCGTGTDNYADKTNLGAFLFERSLFSS